MTDWSFALPGLATHFEVGRLTLRDGSGDYLTVACNKSIPPDRISSDPRKTSCGSCRKTKAWKEAIKPYLRGKT